VNRDAGRSANFFPVCDASTAWNSSLPTAENSAGGSGITPKTAEEIFAAGVDIITSGDHLWDQKEVIGLLQNESRFLRPLNYPQGTPGQGSVVYQANNQAPVAIVNLQGRTFMPDLENPFTFIRAEVGTVAAKDQYYFHRSARGGDVGKGGAGADARRTGQRGDRHAHARADGG